MKRRSGVYFLELVVGMAMLSIVVGSGLAAFHSQRRALLVQREVGLARIELSNLAEQLRVAAWDEILTLEHTQPTLSDSFREEFNDARLSLKRERMVDEDFETYRIELLVTWRDPIHFVDRQAKLFVWRSRR